MPCPGTSCPSLKCQAHLGCANRTFSPLTSVESLKLLQSEKGLWSVQECAKLICTISKYAYGSKVTNVPGSHKVEFFQERNSMLLGTSSIEYKNNLGSSNSTIQAHFWIWRLMPRHIFRMKDWGGGQLVLNWDIKADSARTSVKLGKKHKKCRFWRFCFSSFNIVANPKIDWLGSQQ